MKKKSKTYNEKQIKAIVSKRLIVFFIFFIILLLALVFRLGYLQIVNGSSLKEQAYKNQTLNEVISPKRGKIYDSTGKILAISAQVDTITINPNLIIVKDDTDGSLTKAKKEKVAKGLSDIFSLDYNETLEKVDSNSNFKTIAKKVEQDKVDELKQWMKDNKIYTGINIDEDSKRYYPYSNLASHLIGFCGNDNQGLAGIESKWNDILTGTTGKITSLKDALEQEIPNENQTYIPAENGNDITLTIDVKIQSIAEKYLKEAIEQNDCKRGGNVIIMNTNTGDILAMASYPDYNLNSPFEPNIEFSETWENLDSESKSNALYKMWRNTTVSSTYEPGSTFKLITAAIALEENLVSPDTQNEFTCTGSQIVAEKPIHCWRTTPHGAQSLRQALGNSCNPAFIQLGQRVGKDLLYKYYEAFGLFNKTGIDTIDESTSIFHELKNVNSSELATMSFGQRINITPIQLITAISSIANNGELVQPKIVKQITNTDSNSITNIDSVTVRQVISETTSETMRNLMTSVVNEGTGNRGAVVGYSIGGKTGTSEPAPGKEEEGYIASYTAIAPSDNPEISILVTLHDPSGDIYQGGQIAGPVVSKILTEVLPYLGISANNKEVTNVSEGTSY